MRSRRPGWPRYLAIAWGGVLLFWLPVEDVGVQIVLIMGAVSAALWTTNIIGKRPHLIEGKLWTITGFLGGLAVTPIAAVFMLFKGGLHGYEVPDFDLADLLQVFAQTPAWVLAGLLISAGTKVLRVLQNGNSLEIAGGAADGEG